MAKLPPHVVSMMVYCHRCKTTQHVLQPEKKLAYCLEPANEDINDMQLKLSFQCPACQTKLKIVLCESNPNTRK
jgi:hypothetical protein